MGIFKDLLKVLFLGRVTSEEKLTLEYLAEIKRKTLPFYYEKILKERIVSCEAEIMHLQEKGISVPDVLTNNLQLLKTALVEVRQ